ncbi:hypothetical protein K1719_002620 [Acacia pycnantha]|nr:hypothetical protein K1719_002620 [Acacia pycnantha]
MSRKGLIEQDLSKLDVTKFHPLSPEALMSTVGLKNELERNITMKLGYANAKIYKCEDENYPRPWCYKWAYGIGKEDNPIHISFVDCRGHDYFMATTLNGAAIMDGTLLLIAANESCPQSKTSEHLVAVEIMCLQHLIVLQNKIDLGTVVERAPVVPISAQLKYNIDVVCEYLVNKIPVPVRDFVSTAHMIIIRSFDFNKPGAEVDDIKGGVAGGSILKGVLKVMQLIEIRPRLIFKDEKGNKNAPPYTLE